MDFFLLVGIIVGSLIILTPIALVINWLIDKIRKK